jgi:Dienelactone hydrolase family
MASLPPGECCTQGIKHEGIPKGTIERIENSQSSFSLTVTLFSSSGTYSYISLVLTYFSRPASPNGTAILVFSDVFGPIYQNIQLMADDFAAQGYLVVVPDLFNGDPLSPESFFGGQVDLSEWLTHHDTTTVDPITDVVIDHLKTILKVEKVAGVGYCFGAKVTTPIFIKSRLKYKDY